MGTCFNGCKSLKQGPVLPESVTAMHQIYATAGVTDVYIPLTNVSTYDFALNNTGGITNVTWVGERKSNYNVTSLAGNARIPEKDIQELVPEHLADLTASGTTATLTLGETYLAYLTEDEITEATNKGWILE